MITTTLAKSEKWGEKKNKLYFFENFSQTEKKEKEIEYNSSKVMLPFFVILFIYLWPHLDSDFKFDSIF